jgi:GNAT superfamily N-acetyltransferase
MKITETATSPPVSSTQDYVLRFRAPADLTERELKVCVNIIRQGEAVNIASAQTELPKANAIVLVYCGDEIAGIGAIKRVRPRYAAAIATKCGSGFPATTLELGYVAIDTAHRGRKLAHRLVEALLSRNADCLFATTSTPQMKTVLEKAGFLKHGNEWRGRSSQLSCWVWTRLGVTTT